MAWSLGSSQIFMKGITEVMVLQIGSRSIKFVTQWKDLSCILYQVGKVRNTALQLFLLRILCQELRCSRRAHVYVIVVRLRTHKVDVVILTTEMLHTPVDNTTSNALSVSQPCFCCPLYDTDHFNVACYPIIGRVT